MAEFNEKDHPREDDGKFAPKGEGQAKQSKPLFEPAKKDTSTSATDPSMLSKRVEAKNEKQPEDYEGVKKTPYGYVYNYGNTSITDLGKERQAMGRNYDPNKQYGFSVFVDGDEVFYPTFEEAYNRAKRSK